LNGAPADSASTLSRSGAFLAFADVKPDKPFFCPVALNTMNGLFAAAAEAFMHANSPKPRPLYRHQRALAWRHDLPPLFSASARQYRVVVQQPDRSVR
jgi:hypothetical protein